MPRRISDYPDAYEGWNKVASLGSMISMVSIIIFLVGVYKTLIGPISEEEREETREIPFYNDYKRLGEIKGVRTLEWALPSPPLFHHYDHIPMMLEIKEETSSLRIEG